MLREDSSSAPPDETEGEAQLKLFDKTGKARKKWRTRAMLVDPHKTRIRLAPTVKPRRIPPWVYKSLQSSS